MKNTFQYSLLFSFALFAESVYSTSTFSKDAQEKMNHELKGGSEDFGAPKRAKTSSDFKGAKASSTNKRSAASKSTFASGGSDALLHDYHGEMEGVVSPFNEKMEEDAVVNEAKKICQDSIRKIEDSVVESLVKRWIMLWEELSLENICLKQSLCIQGKTEGVAKIEKIKEAIQRIFKRLKGDEEQTQDKGQQIKFLIEERLKEGGEKENTGLESAIEKAQNELQECIKSYNVPNAIDELLQEIKEGIRLLGGDPDKMTLPSRMTRRENNESFVDNSILDGGARRKREILVENEIRRWYANEGLIADNLDVLQEWKKIERRFEDARDAYIETKQLCNGAAQKEMGFVEKKKNFEGMSNQCNKCSVEVEELKREMRALLVRQLHELQEEKYLEEMCLEGYEGEIEELEKEGYDESDTEKNLQAFVVRSDIGEAKKAIEEIDEKLKEIGDKINGMKYGDCGNPLLSLRTYPCRLTCREYGDPRRVSVSDKKESETRKEDATKRYIEQSENTLARISEVERKLKVLTVADGWLKQMKNEMIPTEISEVENKLKVLRAFCGHVERMNGEYEKLKEVFAQMKMGTDKENRSKMRKAQTVLKKFNALDGPFEAIEKFFSAQKPPSNSASKSMKRASLREDSADNCDVEAKKSGHNSSFSSAEASEVCQ